MRALRSLASAGVTALMLAGLAQTAAAQAPAEFYKGKTVQLLIGFGVGGGNDTWARIIARFMGNHIPGHPKIVPENQPGAGGLLVANRLANVAPKDGTVIGLINRGIPFEPLLAGKGAHFDALKLNYIGSPERDVTVCAARKDAAVKTMQDLHSKTLTVGATGSGADTAVYPLVLSNLFGMKFHVVKGYKGSHQVQLAMERNEVQGICLSYNSLTHGSLFQQHKLNLLLQAALEPDPRLKGIPYGTELGGNPREQQALTLFFAREATGRPFVAPPGVPADRMAALRKAFQDTLRDPDFLATAKKLRLHVIPITGAQLHDVVANAYATPPDIVKLTIKAMGR